VDASWSGYTSINFTTQSLSVPLVEACRCTTGAPPMRSGAASGSVMKVSTSGRPSTKRWSLTSQVVHMSRSPKRTGRGTNGTGLAGSDTYSS
jgi:hypothetical protein